MFVCNTHPYHLIIRRESRGGYPRGIRLDGLDLALLPLLLGMALSPLATSSWS
jgi:hypothetical protein